MRPAGIIAKVVKEHSECEVTLIVNGKEVKAKAPMQIMAACMKQGCDVEIVCNGADEQAVADEIAALFKSGFGE